MAYTYEITALADGASLRTGSTSADADGLLTVDAVPIDHPGVRLVIRRTLP